ncbi:DNA polymerase/3'-5' exonuclease PolX [Chloroflexota bacterium]
MKNSAVARVLEEIAELLELKGENAFKIRAYSRAAHTIQSLSTELEQLMEEERLREVPGIGDALAKKISELLTTGKLEYYEKLRAEFPAGIRALMDIPGVGPRTTMRLFKELNISNVSDLEQAIMDGRVAALERLGDKTAQNILRHIQQLRHKEQRTPLGEALPTVESIFSILNGVPGLRRFRETLGDIDILGTADDPQGVLDAFANMPQVTEVLALGTTKASIIVSNGLQVDLRIVDPESFGSALQYFTGSKEHNVALRIKALKQGLSLSEYGITILKTGEMEKYASEEDYYKRLGLPCIPPELREGGEEIERAEQGTLPKLIETDDIKGDLHIHTDWSDGHNTIEEMALAAKERGYRYIAITDHSAGRGIAHGLNVERLKQQLAEIAELNKRLRGIRLLSGIEVDIRADGSLDLPKEILSHLDIVVAAIHSAMEQDTDRITGRVIAAMESPHVDIIAHPFCRLLGQREPINIDMEQLFQAALRTGTALEINAMPKRLDLKDTYVYRARELGVKLIINTDSHSTEQLDLIRFGVSVARRGWCEPSHILNTRPLKDILAFLSK